jgi:TolB-like protein
VRPAAPPPNSVAVLPFENRARDTSLTLLAEGLADQITTQLGQVRRIQVAPPASVRFVLERSPREPLRLGRGLSSRWLVDGQLLSSGGRVRVSVQLIETATGRVRWTGAFQRPTDDLFAVISSVADSVATSIVGALVPTERADLRPRPTNSGSAMVAYTRGLAALRRNDETNLRIAQAAFAAATEADPAFAAAWAGLAESLIWMDPYVPPRQLYPRARQAAQRALELAPTSADALAALAVIAYCFDWDPVRAESLARRALAHDPAHARARLYLADALAAQARPDEAAPAYRAALAADTLDEGIGFQSVTGLLYARRPEEALTLAGRWRHRMPASELWSFGEALVLTGARRCASAPPTAPIGPLALACAGRTEEARARLDTMVAQVARGAYYVPPGWLALTYAGLGDAESALRWFAQAVEVRTYVLVFARVDPVWDPLRSDPRFLALIERIRPEAR